jgi:hypothetical protein
MSDAERARRYRERKKEGLSRWPELDAGEVAQLRDALRQIPYYEGEIERLRLLNAQLRDELARELKTSENYKVRLTALRADLAALPQRST